MPYSRRFELAIDNLKGSDWERFERLASAFLCTEFPSLRTTASPSGDRGRDAELYSISPTVWFQYSVRKDWRAKITETLSSIAKNGSGVLVLIFVTNQPIGAAGDAARADFSSRGLHLDIRDRNWFVDRVHLSTSTERAAEELIHAIADPLLEERGITRRDGLSLDKRESNAALVYLEMQAHDLATAKGLTKICFDAVVKAALRGSDSEHRISRNDVYAGIQQLLSAHPPDVLRQHIDSAIIRLTKRAIRHYQVDDTFCLTYEYAEDIKESAADVELLRRSFISEIASKVDLTGLPITIRDAIVDIVIEIVETYLSELGEEFATAVAAQHALPVKEDRIQSIAIQLLKINTKIPAHSSIEIVTGLAKDILSSDKDSINKYVRIASDAYTLLAFLSAVPDVQKVTSKLFSDGTIVIDTSALLPIFAERVFSDGKKPFSELFEQAKKVGIELLVTPGVLEEIERHFNLCAAYDRADHWEGRVPYLYQSFILGAKPKGGFRSWSEQFLGSTTPEEDIAEFLREEFGIEVVSIDRHALTRVDDDVRDAVVEFWREAQHRRRSEPGDEIVANRLAEHDIENCLYVLDKRTENKGRSAYGLGVWWLTIDFAASKVASTIEKATGKEIFSPILSLDFLMRNLVFGPRRDHVDLGNTRIFSDTLWDIVPPGLVAIAHEIRTSNVDLPERAIRRKIREELNKQKAQLGPLHLSGLERIEEGLKSMIV